RADGELIVLDAGSGIRELGLALENEFGSRPINLSLLISHLHWDHIQGFPFFGPAYNDKNQIEILGYDGTSPGLGEILKCQMAPPFFPVAFYDLPGKIKIEKLDSMDFRIGNVRVLSKFMNLLSAEQAQKRAGDDRAELVKFLQSCDILILDTQYTDEEYQAHVGWGHGSLSTAISLAVDASVRRLILFHHDPTHDDNMIDHMVQTARKLAAKSESDLEVDGAPEVPEFAVDLVAETRFGAVAQS